MFDEDFSVYTDPTGTGDTALVDGADVYGIFERQYAEVRNVEGYYPTFLVPDKSADDVEKNITILSLSGTSYTAISKRPDGTGMTLLILEKE